MVLIFYLFLFSETTLVLLSNPSFALLHLSLWSSNLFRKNEGFGRGNDRDLWTIEKFQKKVNLDH